MNPFILTLIIMTSNGGASVSQEYSSSKMCENAKIIFREMLSPEAKVLLLTCTPKLIMDR